VRKQIARDAGIATRMRALDQTIGRDNLKRARAQAEVPAKAGEPHYVGIAKCAGCHKSQVEMWKTTVHAHAWKTVVDGGKQYNLECASCHVTGLDKPGGPTLATVEKRGMVDVQCEVCHGPGSKHVEEKGYEEPSSLTRSPPENFCKETCHTKEHSDTFDLVPYLRDVLGAGHGEARRKALGPGVTGHALRQAALRATNH
jgi:hypothetical protein